MCLKLYTSERELLDDRLKSAYKKILKLSPNMVNTIHKLCKQVEDNFEETNDTMLSKLIELVSNVTTSDCCSLHCVAEYVHHDSSMNLPTKHALPTPQK